MKFFTKDYDLSLLDIIPEEIARRIISREKNNTEVERSSSRTKIIPKNSVPT